MNCPLWGQQYAGRIIFQYSSVFIYGDLGNDEIRGSNQSDHLSGGPGSDVVYGNNGGDYIQGGPGIDSLWW